jgi:S1-C subfamily serine protease
VVARPWLGTRSQTVDAEAAASLGLPRPQGVLISAVYPGGAADRAGIRQGDVVLSLDGRPVNDQSGLSYLVATHRPGETMRLVVRSQGRERTVEVQAQTPPANPPRDERTLSGAQPLSGATVVNLSPAVAEEIGADPFVKGVLLTDVNGIAARTGFQRGDLVRAINGREIATTQDLAAATAQALAAWRVVIERDGRTIVADL